MWLRSGELWCGKAGGSALMAGSFSMKSGIAANCRGASVGSAALVLRVRPARERRRLGHRSERGAGVRMADRQAQRIGRILARQARQLQEAHHHLLHLLLARLAMSDD